MNTVSVAVLDENNIYSGTKLVETDKISDNDVVVPDDCDLAVGGYFWDTEKASFVPTEKFIKDQRRAKVFHRKRT